MIEGPPCHVLDEDQQLGRFSLEEAYRLATDAHGRLPGERPGDATPPDAAHWIEIYGELIRFKEEVLEVVRRWRGHMSLDAHVEGGVDEVLISGQLHRYERRRQEWQQALRQLTGSPPLPASGVPLVLDGESSILGHLQIDPRARAVTNAGERHFITPTEWQLLRVFLEHPDHILSREELASQAWGPSFASRTSEVEVYVSRLRRKVESSSAPPLLQTVRGAGYQLVVPVPVAAGTARPTRPEDG